MIPGSLSRGPTLKKGTVRPQAAAAVASDVPPGIAGVSLPVEAGSLGQKCLNTANIDRAQTNKKIQNCQRTYVSATSNQ